MTMRNIGKLLLMIIIAHSAGIIGALFTEPAISGWYAGLAKPFFTPPNWVFGPVWLTLYTLMGMAAFLVWKSNTNGTEKCYALVLFFMQLIVNSAWPIVFFGLQLTGAALVILVILLGLLTVIIKRFHCINRWAAYLLIPYLLWVSFAAVLNIAIVVLN